MELLKKHICHSQYEYPMKICSSSFLTEHVTCVKNQTSKTWTCVKGFYDLYDGTDDKGNMIQYDYKIIEVSKLVSGSKTIFEKMNPNHDLKKL